jgi:hypothetical protein
LKVTKALVQTGPVASSRSRNLSFDDVLIGSNIRPPMSEPSYAPRGMSRVQAAAYVGVSPSLFDVMVRDGRMPGPKLINSRTVWDRFALDRAFETLPDRDSRNPWDEVAAHDGGEHAASVQVPGRGR